jgi:hypothetical protein
MLFRLPVPGEDWTEAERVELNRLCRESGLLLEAGRADEGDPWCIVHDGTMIVAHIARIGRAYVVHWPGEQRSMRAVSITSAVDQVLTGS